MTCSVTSWMRCRFYWKAPRLWIFPSPLSSLRDTDMHRLLCYLKSGWRLAFYKEMRSRALRIPELHRNIFRSGMTGGHAPERGSSRGATSHAPRCLQTGGRSWQMTKKQGQCPRWVSMFALGTREPASMTSSSPCDLTQTCLLLSYQEGRRRSLRMSVQGHWSMSIIPNSNVFFLLSKITLLCCKFPPPPSYKRFKSMPPPGSQLLLIFNIFCLIY